MAGLAIGAYQTAGSVGSYQTVPPNPVAVTPGTGSLTTALFAPVVVENISVTPATAALVTTLFVPTVSAAVDLAVTPGTGTFTTALFAPDVSTSANLTLTPGVVGLRTATRAPQFGGDVRVTPDAGSITSLGSTIEIPAAPTFGWVVTAGNWSETVTFLPGDEFVVTCHGSGITDPSIRVQLLFS